MSTLTVNANTAGKTAFLLDIPDAKSITSVSVTDVSTASPNHYTFAVVGTPAVVATQGLPCRMLVNMTTTRPGGVAPATSGAIHVHLVYVDPSNVSQTRDLGPLAADFVQVEYPANLPLPVETQTLFVGRVAAQELLVPVGGVTHVKSVGLAGEEGTWTVDRNAQADGGLWLNLTNHDTFAVAAAKAQLLSSQLLVTLVADDNTKFQVQGFDVEFFYV